MNPMIEVILSSNSISGTKRFWVRANYGHFNVMDRNTNKMVVGYSKKNFAELTADGLNRMRSPILIEKRIKSLKTVKGYYHFL
jgi:ribulose-5-phosphate 4-epimerase/fuculose-1-phosphate aldolase